MVDRLPKEAPLRNLRLTNAHSTVVSLSPIPLLRQRRSSLLSRHSQASLRRSSPQAPQSCALSDRLHLIIFRLLKVFPMDVVFIDLTSEENVGRSTQGRVKAEPLEKQQKEVVLIDLSESNVCTSTQGRVKAERPLEKHKDVVFIDLTERNVGPSTQGRHVKTEPLKQRASAGPHLHRTSPYAPPLSAPLRIKVPPKLRRRVRWFSELEVRCLKQGVDKYGIGNWKVILEEYLDVNDDIFVGRTKTDLCNKWRNLVNYNHV